MEEKIEAKIDSIIKFIIAKPLKSITLEDYTILSSELRDIRFRKNEEANRERMAGLMAMAFPGSVASGIDLKRD